jgi:hypothetical protein
MALNSFHWQVRGQVQGGAAAQGQGAGARGQVPDPEEASAAEEHL